MSRKLSDDITNAKNYETEAAEGNPHLHCLFVPRGPAKTPFGLKLQMLP